MADGSFICIAHRGASGYRPENTLAAFRYALEMGCRWVELDVHLADGELVVIHDDTLDRTTNGTGKVRECSLNRLRTLDAGDGEGVPLLHEVIDAIDHRAAINIELKGRATAEPTVELLHQYLERGWEQSEFLLSSFQHEELERARGLDGRLRIGPLFGRDNPPSVATCLELDAYSLHAGLRGVDGDLAARAHDAGLSLFVYTANTDAEIRAMFELGADGVFTNYPDRVFALMQEIEGDD